MEAERVEIPREVTSLDDEELWAGFESEETDRILRGEITPKILITTFTGLDTSTRGESIAMVLHSTIPNSRYVMREGIPLCDVIRSAKNDGFTSLVLTGRNDYKHDELHIISLLNGAAVIFRIFEFIPYRELCKSNGIPSACSYGKFCISGHTWRWQNDTITLPQEAPFPLYFDEEALTGESARVRKKQECGPRLTVKLTSVEKLSFETGKFKWVCKPAKKALY